MRPYLLALLTFTLVPLGACNLYFNDDVDVDPPCEWGGGPTTDSLGQQEQFTLRNPESGMCETFYGGGEPPTCDDNCGPCDFGGTGSGEPTPPTVPGEPSPEPDIGGEADQLELETPSWGNCESFCTGLTEDACLVTPDCRGIYTELGFQACWQTDFDTPPTTEPVCDQLGAEGCSRYDQCSALHASSCDTQGEARDQAPEFSCDISEFISCFAESDETNGCYEDGDCGSGFSCNATEICLSPPTSADPCPEELCGVPTPCYGFCVPDADPGECNGDVLCLAFPPECPADTTPGIANGCWTGYCIPLSDCPQTSCTEIANESMCVARPDCDAYYQGINCECTPEGCECDEWQFDSCS